MISCLSLRKILNALLFTIEDFVPTRSCLTTLVLYFDLPYSQISWFSTWKSLQLRPRLKPLQTAITTNLLGFRNKSRWACFVRLSVCLCQQLPLSFLLYLTMTSNLSGLIDTCGVDRLITSSFDPLQTQCVWLNV